MATKRTAFDDRRDQSIADDAGIERHLLCKARGCPNRWTIDVGHLCSAHYHATPHSWPQVTQEQIDAQVDRALAAAAGRVEVEPLTREQKTEILQKLLECGRKQPDKAWAQRLKTREENGERLTPAQREMWRAAIGGSAYRSAQAEFA